MPHSDQVLQRLLMSYKKDARLGWVKLNLTLMINYAYTYCERVNTTLAYKSFGNCDKDYLTQVISKGQTLEHHSILILVQKLKKIKISVKNLDFARLLF